MGKKLIAGIDLGTTNSTCSVIELGDKPSMIKDNLLVHQLVRSPGHETPYGSKTILPSVVWLSAEGRVFTGNYCKIDAGRETKAGDRLIRSIKRHMGDRFWSCEVAGKTYTPSDISAFILRTILSSLESRYRDPDLESVSITIPASFSSSMRRDTLRAAELAGFDLSRVKLRDEPVAAFFSTLKTVKNTNASPTTAMVFDMGGGTLDVCCMKVAPSEKLVSVMGVSRYNEVAGDDLDLEIAALILKNAKKQDDGFFSLSRRKNGTEKRKLALGILEMASDVKLGLSDYLDITTWQGSLKSNADRLTKAGHVYPVDFSEYFPDASFEEINIHIGDLLKAVWPLMKELTHQDSDDDLPDDGRSILFPIDQALRRAQIEMPDKIYLTGGSSRFPPVQYVLGEKFNQRKPIPLDFDLAVSQGAALWAYWEHVGRWGTEEKIHDSIFIKRTGHPFLKVLPPMKVNSPWLGTEIPEENCPYLTKGAREFDVEFFRGTDAFDPLMELAHVERVRLPFELAEDSKLVEVQGRVDDQKVFHFGLTFRDSRSGRLVSASAVFKDQTGQSLTAGLSSLGGVTLNGVTL